MATPFYTRHRGPYQLSIMRDNPDSAKAKLRYTSESLPGTLEGEDCQDEALSLLTDPRDTIISVYVWSVPESQHVCTFREKDTIS